MTIELITNYILKKGIFFMNKNLIINAFYSDNNKVNMMLMKENTNQLYYCSYDKKENETLFKVGDRIKIIGIIKGNQKIAAFDQNKKTYEYVIYPRMYIHEILENEK